MILKRTGQVFLIDAEKLLAIYEDLKKKAENLIEVPFLSGSGFELRHLCFSVLEPADVEEETGKTFSL